MTKRGLALTIACTTLDGDWHAYAIFPIKDCIGKGSAEEKAVKRQINYYCREPVALHHSAALQPSGLNGEPGVEISMTLEEIDVGAAAVKREIDMQSGEMNHQTAKEKLEAPYVQELRNFIQLVAGDRSEVEQLSQRLDDLHERAKFFAPRFYRYIQT